MDSVFLFADRRSALAFWFGSAIVAIGVVLHLPMFWMARNSGFILAGMPMDPAMLLGMALIVGGIAVAGYGLLPNRGAQIPQELISPPEDAPLTLAHWKLMAVLALALIIDVMKPASLGFVTPGMRTEYGIDRATVALLPFSALIGTAAGSFIWGSLADLYGRRAAILLSSVMFVGTSICGAMPSLWWNIGMCFLMGAAAGGMLPVAYALLAEIMPTKHRGWCLVLIGGIGTIGGYFAASELSALLQPFFGWRIMWFLNLPTGLMLIALSPFIPESTRFLQFMGRTEDARATLARFGSVKVHSQAADEFTPASILGIAIPKSAQRSRNRRSAHARGGRVGFRQFWGIAMAAQCPGGGRTKRGPRERRHCALDSHRSAHRRGCGLSLQRVEHQVVTDHRHRHHHLRFGGRDVARHGIAADALQPNRSPVSTHRRIERPDFHTPSLLG